jgi:hypothetical protein
MMVEIGNFLDFRPTELVRGISIALHIRQMGPVSGSKSTSPTWVVIATLSSDIEIGLLFRGSDDSAVWAYKKLDGTWAIAPKS